VAFKVGFAISGTGLIEGFSLDEDSPPRDHFRRTAERQAFRLSVEARRRFYASGASHGNSAAEPVSDPLPGRHAAAWTCGPLIQA